MTLISNGQTSVILTEWGLTIAGTGITLYDVMDYVTAQYPPKFIRGLFELTEEQGMIFLIDHNLICLSDRVVGCELHNPRLQYNEKLDRKREKL